jgi:hypothetical protein
MLTSDDVKRAWEKTTEFGRAVDFVVFTIGEAAAATDFRAIAVIEMFISFRLTTSVHIAGAMPEMGSFKVTKGLTINPPNITKKLTLNVFCTMPDSVPRPKVITITSIGVTKDSPIPLVYKPLYPIKTK